tara:strand:+ start:56 stop:457 length:402 start_codon:yes stop_codon:yes gene_type:complete
MSVIETSFVIASRKPRELADFYAKVNNVKLCLDGESDFYEVILQDGLKLRIYKPSLSQEFSTGGRSASLCFQKSPSNDPFHSLQTWSLQITKYGGKIVSDLKLEPFGAEGWVSDPDGNNFLIFIPSISWVNTP